MGGTSSRYIFINNSEGGVLGGTITKSNSYISNTGEELRVVCTTLQDSRPLCILRALVESQTATLTVIDYTFDNQVTTTHIKVEEIGGSGRFGPIEHSVSGRYSNWTPKVGGQFELGCGNAFLGVVKESTSILDYLTVTLTHQYYTQQRTFAVMFSIWYDVGKCHFMCTLTGPFETYLRLLTSYLGGNQTNNPTTTSGLINNSGHVLGHYNGSLINYYINNLFNVMSNNK